jgi:hypothetical protein
MLFGRQARAPDRAITQLLPSSQSEFEQHALAHRLSIRLIGKPNEPGRKQNPALQSESLVHPLPTGRGTMHTPVGSSHVRSVGQAVSGHFFIIDGQF